MNHPADAFEFLYGTAPTHLAHAPGRVNLIGEHIDYAGLPVFPMAIQRAIRIAFRAIDEPVCRIATDHPDLEPRSFRLDGSVEPYPTGDWGNYPKAAVVGIREWRDAAGAAGGRGIEALITSDLPVAAGLGSSSALVVACALALLEANDDTMDPLELASRMAEAERFTGTRGGGMDQAICLCARPGTASLVSFDPLRVESVRVPDGWRFIVAHSLVEARKSGGAQATYNRRRAEVESALHDVAAALGPADGGEADSSGGSDATYRALLAGHGPDALLGAADRALEADVRPRFKHVITEAGRVAQAGDAMKRADMSAFGELMNASHRSLRDDFAVSTPELDELTDLAIEAGAAGARLTGAGLGGAIVALTEASRVDSVLGALWRGFYESRVPAATDVRARALADALFVAVPSGGASVRGLDLPVD